ncbi:MAG: hypothetical protein IKU03_09915 [Bacteroidales bacterium]|nr:hypothetical protein [Bacteroidales bacterium]
MKRLIKGIFCVVIVALLAACEIGEGEMGKTRTGKQIFDGWGNDMNNLFSSIVEPALLFNQYLENPEFEMENLLHRYFNDATITETGDQSWLIYHERSDSKLYLSMLHGNSLNDEGAVMRIYTIGRNLPSTIAGAVFFLEKAGDGQWILRNSNTFFLTLDFESETLPSSLKNSKLTISGNGSFNHNTHDYSTATYYIFLDFNIHRNMVVNQNIVRLSTWPWQSYGSPVIWDSGSVELTAANQSNGGSNTAEALILDSKKVSITIGGVTQEWDQSLPYGNR